MTSKYENYYSYVQKDAENFLDQYYRDFLSEIKDGNTDAYSLIDDDNKLHEWADDYINLRDAVEILEQSNNVETDSGLWEGLEPVSAVESMGFWTLKNDLSSEIREQFKEKLEEDKGVVDGRLASIGNYLKSLQKKLSDLVAELEDLQGLDDDDEDYEEAQVKIESLETDIEELEEEISDTEDVVTDLENEIDYIETAIDDL